MRTPQIAPLAGMTALGARNPQPSQHGFKIGDAVRLRIDERERGMVIEIRPSRVRVQWSRLSDGMLSEPTWHDPRDLVRQRQ